MDIALSGIILLVLVLPGISFAKGYYSREFSNQYSAAEFYNLTLNTIIPSIVFYLLALPLILIFGYTYNFETLFGIISSNDNLVSTSIRRIENHKYEILIFHILINSFAFIAGRQLYNIVLKNSLDTKYDFLRYKNIWHYLITARFLNFKQNSEILQTDKIEDIDYTYIDALITINEKTFIYTGILIDYHLAKDGGLDLLIIDKAQRKLIGGDPEEIYKDIIGNYLILKYSNIINLNLSFIQLQENIDSNGNIVSFDARIIE